MKFNECLKSIRKRSKVTQKTIADHLGVTVRTYQRYEEGTIEPPLSTVFSIAEYFDVPSDCLLGNGFFSNWEEVLLHKEDILSALHNRFFSFPDNFDVLTLTEGQLARLLSAVFHKITFDETGINFFPLIPKEMLPIVIHAGES